MGVSGVTIGLVAAGLLLGLRHGIDWDHIVAITDIVATSDSRRRGALFGTIYALGHASVILVLGLGAIALGATVPEWVDAVMGRVVGITLILLGLLVGITLLREGRGFRARSRWMILFGALRRARRALGTRFHRPTGLRHTHPHAAVETAHHDHDETPNVATSGSRLRAPIHHHPHTHDDAFAEYGKVTSLGIGMIHGVGAETPTQVVVFLAAASAGGLTSGLAVLLAFVVGLVVSNSAITAASTLGFATVTRRQTVQLVFGGLTAIFSIVIGGLFLVGLDTMLPAFFGG